MLDLSARAAGPGRAGVEWRCRIVAQFPYVTIFYTFVLVSQDFAICDLPGNSIDTVKLVRWFVDVPRSHVTGGLRSLTGNGWFSSNQTTVPVVGTDSVYAYATEQSHVATAPFFATLIGTHQSKPLYVGLRPSP